MTVQLSVAVRNARLDAIETTIAASAVLKIRSGAQPANCAAADTGTVAANSSTQVKAVISATLAEATLAAGAAVQVQATLNTTFEGVHGLSSIALATASSANEVYYGGVGSGSFLPRRVIVKPKKPPKKNPPIIGSASIALGDMQMQATATVTGENTRQAEIRRDNNFWLMAA